ncbi:hypothetical protein [Caldimonas caldifontis]|uniref:Uncharacterized protein n=1 Tax=Caldimonas caldifontis TaxID=1452508 RepID=A0A2S5SVK1_9BURK|nr:hypothetical protein [Caldimonas caldifontis]PPE66781.1 hypothetical protein C1704_07305 [Caldimonas caldifontis]
MAFPWLVAFKVIPWKDVIEATPAVVRGAKQLWHKVRQDEAALEAAQAAAQGSVGPDAGSPEARIAQLEKRVAEMSQEAVASSELIQALAQHNERLVAAVDTLRVRTRVLMWVSALLAGGVLALFFLR